ncbi:class III lanthipeptide [Idiomarina xiamenensis]|nr:class III lanthipeptide [Idiomarina xiamenensis]
MNRVLNLQAMQSEELQKAPGNSSCSWAGCGGCSTASAASCNAAIEIRAV